MIAVPENAVQIDSKLIAYKDEYRGKTYIHICKTYLDPKSGEPAIGRGGLSLSPEQWETFKDGFDTMCKGLE
jgi:hypothetical protein